MIMQTSLKTCIRVYVTDLNLIVITDRDTGNVNNYDKSLHRKEIRTQLVGVNLKKSANIHVIL